MKLEKELPGFCHGMHYHEYIQHPIWLEKAKNMKIKEDFTCQKCHKNKFYYDNEKKIKRRNLLRIDVHHKHYKSLGSESSEDLMVLCSDCHKLEHES